MYKSTNCKHYQRKEKKRKISGVVSLWNLKGLNLKECSLIIASKFSKCLYVCLSEPRFFCVSCLMIFRIYSNIFCFSPCICCEFAVSLKEVLPRCCAVSEHCTALFCREPASRESCTHRYPTCKLVYLHRSCSLLSALFRYFCKIILRS